MLDSETKRRIDTARDILVGKVPDPKSQVEQITIALIYKFMDDMDAGSEELGGTRKFFAGEFARYGWPKLMRSGLGGHEILNLYAEAIDRMQENPGIPQLFRDIFNNAYLPYRDPETLRAFLKIIDEFTYDHSERLGDAFEYLLSVLGSQGDAGQFRTPRHIIDFIVAVVDPKKNETILDPACGTAGFLISSYKHILAANTDDKGNNTLTPDERNKLTANFQGYDISPDMVRLSLVNLYLHGFQDPHIFEYDTLTSEERWTEYADVILANPPFMSPKGGIRPHNRFSVQSKRSEVLFVDYMAEHLTPSGRAGIIVPEGIIFQSQNAHKQLRKMLVEDYLVAVVSLPAGVFNPYSGVKTSILVLDKSLAKRTDSIAFFKVENDGFDLGAQRRPIDSNDLPHTQLALREYMENVGNMDGQDKQDKGGPPPSSNESMLDELIQQGPALVVEKTKITEGGEYNLSGERYRDNSGRHSHFPIVPLGKIAEVIAGQSPPGKSYNETGIGMPFYQGKAEFRRMFIGEPSKWTTAPQRLAQQDDILMSVRAPVGPVNFATQEICIGRGLAAIRPKAEHVLGTFAFYVLRSLEPEITGDAGAAFVSINKGAIEKIEIPLPPLEVQREIVAEIEGYQRVIDGARAVIDNYKPHIPINPEWPMVEIGEVCETVQNGYPVKQSDHEGRFRVTRIQTIANGAINLKKTKWTNDNVPQDRIMRSGDILFSHINSIDHLAKTALFVETEVPVVHGINLIRLRPRQCNVLPDFMLWSLKQDYFVEKAKSYAQRAVNQASIKVSDIRTFQIPLPPIESQRGIVTEIKAEQALLDANRNLIARFEKKIQAAIGRVWGEGKHG